MLRRIGWDSVQVVAGQTATARIQMQRAIGVSTFFQMYAVLNTTDSGSDITVWHDTFEPYDTIVIKEGFDDFGRTLVIDADVTLLPMLGRDVRITRRGGANSFNGAMFDVADGGTLTLGNSHMIGSLTIDGRIEVGAAAPIITVDGSLIMHHGAALAGNRNVDGDGEGGAVSVGQNGGVFTMYGGAIIGNEAGSRGGGVLVQQGGAFNMLGGAIAGNEAMRGGGVFVGSSGAFYMHGGFVFGADGAAHAPRGAPNTVAADGSGAALFVANSGTAQFGGPLADAFGAYIPMIFNDTLPAAASVTLDGIPFSSLADAFQAITRNAGYVVTVLNSLQSAPIDRELPYGASIILRGASLGREVALSSPGSLFTINSGVALTLENIALRGRENNNAALVAVEAGGTLTMYAGALIAGNHNATCGLEDGGYSRLGGGVRVEGTFNMRDGEISGNRVTADASSGGGVFVSGGGVFLMGGGANNSMVPRISGNHAGVWGGGGVLVDHNGSDDTITHNFVMYSGIIENNHATGGGGGVHVGAHADYYGGIFIMRGGTIALNTATGSGGGVFVARSPDDAYGRFYMHGGTIHNNRATSNSNGGGVFVSGRFEMSEDSPNQSRAISNNTAEGGDGGGVFIGMDGIFVMHGNAVIQGNRAIDGGGVFVGGSFEGMSGNILGNTATRSGGGVFIAAGASFENNLQIEDNTGSDVHDDSSDN